MSRKNKFIVLFLITFCFCAVLTGSYTYFTKAEEMKFFKSDIYKISLKYESTWVKNYNYKERYEGPNGFFQVVASTGINMTVDDIARIDAEHVAKPYGSNPRISKITIDNVEGRLIEPSSDQFSEYQNTAEVVFKSPKSIIINGEVYDYIIIYADKYHINDIAKSVKFIE